MEEEKQLETFTYCEIKNGQEHFYRITANDAHYIVEKDGCIIEQVLCDSEWRQISGKPLSDALIRKLGDRIERHYC